ncbi:MAG: adenosylcobinamide-GDP ribazoletransferase [Desulfitobacteriaceae bacterium]
MRALLIAFTFLTRIPLPQPQDVTAEEFARSQRYYPLIGLFLGLVLWGTATLVGLWYPPLAIAAILLALEIILTGGLHLDGFMDSMDGLLSARTRERMLEIMKDSRVGAHASITLAALLILKFSLLASFSPSSYSFLILPPLLARWAFLIAVIHFPYARSQGLGKGFHESSHWLFFILEGVAINVCVFWFFGLAGVSAVLSALLFVTFFSWRVARLLGGLTGDIYGATIEITEVVVLIATVPFL